MYVDVVLPNTCTPAALSCNFLFDTPSPIPSKNFVVVPNCAIVGSPPSAVNSIPVLDRTTCVSITSIAACDADALLIAVVAEDCAEFAEF